MHMSVMWLQSREFKPVTQGHPLVPPPLRGAGPGGRAYRKLDRFLAVLVAGSFMSVGPRTL